MQQAAHNASPLQAMYPHVFSLLLQPSPAAEQQGGEHDLRSSQGVTSYVDSDDDDTEVSALICPLTLDIMTDPVVCAGKQYKLLCICKYLSDHLSDTWLPLLYHAFVLELMRSFDRIATYLRILDQCGYYEHMPLSKFEPLPEVNSASYSFFSW